MLNFYDDKQTNNKHLEMIDLSKTGLNKYSKRSKYLLVIKDFKLKVLRIQILAIEQLVKNNW